MNASKQYLSVGFIICLIGLVSVNLSADPKTCSAAVRIEKKIKKPVIPDQTFLITDFGAISGLENNARPAIMSAIDEAVNAGGGRVIIPAGLWFSKGPIVLKSKIDLHLAQGARLVFSPEPEDYLPVVLTRWEGTEVYSYSPLIYARNVHDVAITGLGVIDGNEQSKFFAWHPKEKPDQLKLRQMGANGVAVEERIFGAGHYLRPPLIQFFSAERVLLQDYTAKHSPFWVNHLNYTTHVTMRGIKVDSHHANNDGIDVESSRYVLVENNHFRTGDDSAVVKAGRDLDGRTIGRPSEHIVFRNNDMGGEDGIALGSEMSGGIRDVYFIDNTLRTGTSAVRFKSNLDRGGVVEKIRVCNMTVESFDDLFWFQLDYPGALGGNFPSVYRDIIFENITVDKAGTVLSVHAPEGTPLQNVTFNNVEVKSAEHTFVLKNAENLRFNNVTINGERVDGHLSWQ